MKYILTVLVSFLVLATVYPAANAQTSDKTLICHATGSSVNPYNANTVDKNSDVGGHDGHENDIIPPFTYEENQPGGGTTIESYPGKNWSSEGQAIWENGCVIPTQTPTPTNEPSQSPTPTPTIEPTPTPTNEPTPTKEPTPSKSPTPTPIKDITDGNTCIVNNYVNIKSNTGKNRIKNMVGGISNIFTGKSIVNTNITNKCGSNYVNLNLRKNNKIKFNISKNGSGSFNIINYSSIHTISINQ